VSDASGGLAEVIREQIERPEIAAMLLAKTTVAAERSVSLKLTTESRLAQTGVSTQALLTIIGNLIDNAIEAAAAAPAPGWVTVHLHSDADGTSITVSDSGAGVPPALEGKVFTDGFSTKPVTSERHRGLGLALVHRLVRREGGRVWIESRHPTVFRVVLPTRAASAPEATTPHAAPEVTPGAPA
jgi:two-component system CitB family sensor kinase